MSDLEPRGFIVVGIDYDGPDLLSVHGTVEAAREVLPWRVEGSSQRFGLPHSSYQIINVATLKPVAQFYWKYDCSGAPVFWQLEEEFEGANV